MKDGAYVINHDEYESIGTHGIALYFNANNIVYSDSLLQWKIFQKKLEK